MAAHVVHVLREDPALAAALEPAEFDIAAQHLVAGELRVPAGGWTADHPLGQSPGDLGFLVLDGLLTRETAVGRHSTAELLGPGDLLRPWDDADSAPDAPVEAHNAWRVLEPARLAVLDARFATLSGRLPTVTAELMSRTLRRSRLLALLLVLSAMPRLDARLLALLWHLADRYGSVSPDGTVVPLPLTHATLGMLVSAQRPSVTSALGALEEHGLLRRTRDGFLLLGDPPGDPEQAVETAAAAAAAAAG